MFKDSQELLEKLGKLEGFKNFDMEFLTFDSLRIDYDVLNKPIDINKEIKNTFYSLKIYSVIDIIFSHVFIELEIYNFDFDINILIENITSMIQTKNSLN